MSQTPTPPLARPTKTKSTTKKVSKLRKLTDAQIAEEASLMADAAQSVMIGDTQFDVLMAVNAGVRAIGVDWGYHSPHELLDAGAETVVRSPAELLEILQ